jgi:hypothetical protein
VFKFKVTLETHDENLRKYLLHTLDFSSEPVDLKNNFKEMLKYSRVVKCEFDHPTIKPSPAKPHRS